MNHVVDDYGNQINIAQLKEPQTGGAVPMTSDWNMSGTGELTPDKLRTILRGQGNLRQIVHLGREIEEKDPHMYGEFAKRRRRILSREWQIHAPEGASAKAQKAADFVSEWLASVNEFEEVLFDLTEGTSHLVGCHEMVWGTLDGIPVPVQFNWRSQDYLRLKRTGVGMPAWNANRTDLRYDDGSPDGQELWAGGWLIHVHKAKSGYLDRAGMPRILAAYFMLKHHFTMQNLPRWGEVYGIPPRIGKYDAANIDPAGKRALWNAIRHMGQDAGGIIPATMSIELLEAATGNVDAFMRVAQMVDQYASKAILGRDTVASGGLNGGSGQNEANNADMATDLNIADCKQVARTITQDLIWPVVQYFGITDMRECPQFRFDTAEPADMVSVALRLKTAKEMGMGIKAEWAYEQLQIPKPDPDDELLEAPAPPPPAPNITQPMGAPAPEPANAGAGNATPKGSVSGQPEEPAGADIAEAVAQAVATQLTSLVRGRLGPPRDEMDNLVDAMLSEWQPEMDSVVDPIRAEIAAAAAKGESPESLLARLPALLDAIDITSLTERLARGGFAAHLAGRAGMLDPKPRTKRG